MLNGALPTDLEEALAVSRGCQELISSPAYLDAMRGLEAYHVSAMVAAPEGPDGSTTREHHHRMLHALRDLAGDLAARASAVADLEKLLDGAQGEPEDEIEEEI